MKKKSACLFVIVLVWALPVYAENEFLFRLSPQFAAPAGIENFGPGFGAAASLDWVFDRMGSFVLPHNMGMGLSFGGGFSRLSIADGSVFNIFDMNLGPFFQWRMMDRLTLRGEIFGGIYNYQWEDDSNSRVLAGTALSAYFHLLPSVSLFASGGYTAYSFSAAHPINTVHIGLGVSLNLSEIIRPEARVSGEKTAQRQVFPVSYAWYENNSVATVKISNDELNTITGVTLTFFLERYMNQGTVFASIPRLLPGESVEVPVRALFNESMLDLTENTVGNANVIIEYRSLGAKRQASFPMQMPIYHRNAMSWDDDRRAASFVSARDPAAALFAKYTASAVDRSVIPGRFGNLPENVLLAASLFETLNLYGINYVIDPASSYIQLSENASALDSLNYPYQTLMYRGGDCDDLSILFCSLLEVLEIDTAFITIPGHIYIAFDAGETAGWTVGGGKPDLIEYEGRSWLPVEITVPRAGFAEAWEIGSLEWNLAETEAAIYPMRDSWKLYQPVSVPGAGSRLPDMPGEEAILKAVQAEMEKIR
jgi:hypothetical protein